MQKRLKERVKNRVRFYLVGMSLLSMTTTSQLGFAHIRDATEARIDTYRTEPPAKHPVSRVASATPPDWVKATLKEMVDTNSGSQNAQGLEQMRTLVTRLFTSLGYKAQTVEVGQATDANGKAFTRKVLVFEFPNARPDVLFIGHVDTVFELSSQFQKFSEQGSQWHGPGVADMKGGLILAAHVLREIQDTALLARVRIVVSDDEEKGSPVSGPYMKKFADLARYGLIFESSPNADITTSHSGLLWNETTVYGVASHAGQAHAEGVNACLDNSLKMVELYRRILDYSRGLTISAGIVNTPARAKPNITCDEITTTYDIRYVYPEDGQRTQAEMTRVMAMNLAPNPKNVPVPASSFKLTTHYPAMPAQRTHLLASIYKEAGAKIGIQVTAEHKGAVDAYGIIDSPIELLSGLGVYGSGMHSDKELTPSELYMRKLQLNVAFMRELFKR